MSKNSKIILSLLLIVLIVGGGVYWWNGQGNESIPEIEEATVEDETTSVVSEEHESTNTWEGDGFSFTYSNELVAHESFWSPPASEGLWAQDRIENCADFDQEAFLESTAPGDMVPPCTFPDIAIKSETTDLSFEEYISKNYRYLTTISSEQIRLGENDFTKGTLEDLGGTTYYFAENNGTVVIFYTLGIHQVSDLQSDRLTEIMSTLQFE